MAKNKNLHSAKREKNDEFYTQLTDIEKELVHYREHFKDKVVFLNCGDAPTKNFWVYFTKNFEKLGLKRLIATSFTFEGHGSVHIYDGDKNGNRQCDPEEVKVIQLEGNGDFRSAEVIEYLKQCDIVVSNPPFSLFREYVKQLMDYNKKFLILGNMNAITYKEIFPLIKENKVWLGMSTNGSNRWFEIPQEYPVKANASGYKEENGKRFLFVNGIMWFTNLDNNKRHEVLELTKKYSNECYPKYDNYDAVEVSLVVNIPMDYDGVMGVPISFLNKYNPEQFEIIGITENNPNNSYLHIDGFEKYDRPYLCGKRMYSRLLIRHKR